jgi:hypothetical protein
VEVIEGCLAGHESGLDARGYDVAALSLARALRPRLQFPPHSLRAPSSTMSGPVASNLVLLSDLPGCAQGTKVRFLGWYLDSRP